MSEKGYSVKGARLVSAGEPSAEERSREVFWEL